MASIPFRSWGDRGRRNRSRAWASMPFSPCAVPAPAFSAAMAPAEASAAPAPTAPAASAVPAEAASAPTAPAASAVPVETAHAPKLSPKVPGGYRLVKRNGKELYCKSVTTIGTRFAEQMCFTREQIAEIDERTNHAMDDFEKARKTCTGGAYCTEM